jgi:glycosyltransferase involved in cell wall biosynthesis
VGLMNKPVKMNIIHLRDTCGMYGIEKCILWLANWLYKNNTPVNFQVAIMSRSKNILEHDFIRCLQKHHIKGRRIEVNKKNPFRIIRSIVRLINRYPGAIIHTHDFKSNLFGAIAAFWTKSKLISTYHGHIIKSGKTRFYNWLDFLILKYFPFACIICVSNNNKKILLAKGIREDKIITIPNGIEIPASVAIPSNRTGNGKKIIGFIGRLSAEKGCRYLIDAVPEVISRHPDTYFMLAGDGYLRADLERQVCRLNIGDRVLFSGFEHNIKKILAKLDILIIPSLSEGAPIVLLEALAFGVPVIGSNIGSLREIIINEKTGILVPAKDARSIALQICRLLEEEGLRQKLAASGYEYIRQKHNIDFCHNMLLQLYKEIDQSAA